MLGRELGQARRHGRLADAALAGDEHQPQIEQAGCAAHLPRAYLVAGTQEPFFLENAARWADALRGAGADVVMAEREGTHGGPFWRAEFPRMAAWAFGA